MTEVSEQLARDIEDGNRLHAAEIVKVTVAQGIQVVHEGERYPGGTELEVPGPLAHKWIRAGWVTESEPKEQEDNADEQDTESPRRADRKDAARRAGGTARAGTRR